MIDDSKQIDDYKKVPMVYLILLIHNFSESFENILHNLKQSNIAWNLLTKASLALNCQEIFFLCIDKKKEDPDHVFLCENSFNLCYLHPEKEYKGTFGTPCIYSKKICYLSLIL